MRHLRRVRTPLLALVLALTLAALVDAVAATRTEHQISRHLREVLDLPMDPAVGIPVPVYLRDAARGSFTQIDVRAEDIESPLFGMITLELTLKDAVPPGGSFPDGDLEGTRARLLSSRLMLDTSTVGRLLDIPDLQIRSCRNSSPIGLRENCGILTGTVKLGAADTDEYVVAARVGLSIRDGNLAMVPDAFETGLLGVDATVPGPLRETVLSRFSYVFHPSHLPFGRTPSLGFFRGGSLFIDSDMHDVTVDRALMASAVPR